jgi:trimeric autotransporter adhesin
LPLEAAVTRRGEKTVSVALRAFGEHIKRTHSSDADSADEAADPASAEDATQTNDQTTTDAEASQAQPQADNPSQADDQAQNQTDDLQNATDQSQDSEDSQNESDNSQDTQDQPPGQTDNQTSADDTSQAQADDQPQDQADDQPTTDDQTQASDLQSITLTPDSPSLAGGGQQQFTATGDFADGSSQDVTSAVAWSSSDTTVVSIDASGLASAQGAGSATITATHASTGVTASTGITVQGQAPGSSVLQKITISPQDPLLENGKLLQFSATGTFSDGTTQDMTGKVRWTSSAPQVAPISSGGIASGGNTPGNATITATDPSTNVTDSTKVTVPAAGKAPALQFITISPSNPSLTGFVQQQFKATGTFADGSKHEMTNRVLWNSSDLSVITIDSNGLATAGTVSGTATIDATDPTTGIGDATSVTLTVPALQTITISPKNPSVANGETVQLSAEGTFSDGSKRDVTSTANWSSSDISVASGSSGLVTTLSAGTATITATDTGTGVAGSASLTVTAPVLKKITISPDSATIPSGFTQEFSAEAEFSDGHPEDVTSTVDWASAADTVVEITNNGIATGKAAGTATITATDPATKATGLANVTVGAPVVAGLRISPRNPSIAVGGKVQFTATGDFSDRHTEDVTTKVLWTSRDEKVVEIDQSGVATGKAAGSASIAAEDSDKRALQSTSIQVTQ